MQAFMAKSMPETTDCALSKEMGAGMASLGPSTVGQYQSVLLQSACPKAAVTPMGQADCGIVTARPNSGSATVIGDTVAIHQRFSVGH